LVEQLDGKTNGQYGLVGNIGKNLGQCENLPIKKFKIIKNNLPTINTFLDLSTDQKYLLEIVQAVSLGEIYVSLSFRNPGKLSHARWLTMVNRILRLYVGTENPSKKLQLLAEYIVKVYAPI
jgi:hypothetical protein